MRRVVTIAAFAAGIFSVLLFAAELPSSCVPWSADRPITWSDFWAPAPAWAEKDNSVAATNLLIQWNAHFAASRAGSAWTAYVTSLTVTCVLDSSKSWAIPSRTSSEALRHEQLHFDLYEVYRRLLETTLGPMTYRGTVSGNASNDALANLLRSSGAAILQRAEAATLLYDSETDHGQNTLAQAAWEDRIAALLLHPAAAP